MWHNLPVRLLLAALLAAPLLAAEPASAVEAPRPVDVRVLQANVGNVNVTPGACGDQAVKLCLRPVEERITAGLRALDPQVVLLQELLPALLCRPPERPGAFGTSPHSLSLRNPEHLCPDVLAGLEPDDQVDRLLPPEQWETRCNAPSIDPADRTRAIPPWDCISVRRDLGRIASFTTLDGTAPGAVPGETCDNGFTMNVALLDVGRPLQVTSAHPDSGGQRAGCRAEKLARLLNALGGSSPTVPTVLAGDFNFDPYRTPDVSTELWDRFVSRDGTTPYGYRSGIAEADPAPVTLNFCGASQLDPTGSLLDGATQPPAGCTSTLDHVAATPDVTGPCDTLGEPPGDSARLDGGGGTDHRAILCDFTVGALASSAAPTAAPPPPGGEQGAGPTPGAASARALPATGLPTAPTALALVVLGLLVATRARSYPSRRAP